MTKVSGIFDQDNEEWELEFDEDGLVTEDCIDDLLSLEISDKLSSTVTQFLNGYPKDGEVKDPLTGKTLDGVTIIQTPKSEDKKKV